MRRLHRKTDRYSLARRAGSLVPAGRDGGGGRLKKILVADDDPASVELLTAYLSANGYDVADAFDGNRALDLGDSGDFDLAILDVHMPMYDGVEVVQMLRRRHVLHPLRVIALTGDASDATRDALDEAGVDAYLVKPVDLKGLIVRVRELIG